MAREQADSPEALEQAMREALKPGPDPAARVTCSTCGGVLAEYQYGVARYTCRHCRWRGIITRLGPAPAQDVRTLRPGRRREGREEG